MDARVTVAQSSRSLTANHSQSRIALVQTSEKKHKMADSASEHSSHLSRPLPDKTSKLAEATKREMRMIQRESWKVRRSEGRKVLGALMMLNRAQGRISL